MEKCARWVIIAGRDIKMTLRFLVVLWVVGAPRPIQAIETNAILNAWLSSQTNITSWSAEFIQTRVLKVLRDPLVTTGRVWFARPSRFRWELGSPAQTIAIRDAKNLRIYY